MGLPIEQGRGDGREVRGLLALVRKRCVGRGGLNTVLAYVVGPRDLGNEALAPS